MLYLIGIIITFFLSLLLVSKKNKSLADKILAAWLICTGIHLSLFYVFVSGYYNNFPYFLGLEIAMPMLQGPFLFLYTMAVTQTRSIKPKDGFHFLPFVVVLIILSPFFSLASADKIAVYQHEGAGYETLTQSVLLALSLSGVIYIILSLRILRKHAERIKQQFSNTDRINLNWLRYLIWGIAAIWAIILIGFSDAYIFGAVVIYVFFLGFFGIKQVGVFTNNILDDNLETEISVKERVDIILDRHLNEEDNSTLIPPMSEEGVEAKEKVKYQNSSLDPAEGHKIFERLQYLMEEQKLFKNPELALGELAQELQLHPNILSQVINSYAQKTFYDYVNDLRITEFKTIVAKPEHKQYTLLSLAFECGFNSKTAFNRNFKKATGLSPTQYIQQLNNAIGDNFIPEA